MLPEYVWDAGVLEGNPFTFPEVKTVVEGVTVGGRKVSDHGQIQGLADSSEYLIELVKQRRFGLDSGIFCALKARVARHRTLECGHFRSDGAQRVCTSGIHALQESVANPFERAVAFFLFGSLHRFFFSDNKHTSRFMMNGVLMSEGIDAISIPAIRAQAFNTRMVDFYVTRDATQMMAFVLECHPEIGRIREVNPGLPVVENLPNIKYYRMSEPQQAHATGVDREL